MSLEMKRDYNAQENRWDMALIGEVDISNASLLRAELKAMFDENASSVNIDIKDLSYIDSTGLGVIIGAYGRMKEQGVSVQHMHVSTLKPFTDPSILEAIRKCKGGVVTIENHYEIGGLGSAVADMMAENGIGRKLIKIGLPGYTHGASKMYLMKKYGIDAMHLVHAVEELTGKELNISEEYLLEERFVDFLEV
jgi:anti-anti-sigma factor